MRYVEFNANGMMLSKRDEESFKHIIMGSRGYLAARIAFDDDWAGTSKAVVFVSKIGREHPVRCSVGIAPIPDELTAKAQEIGVYVVGARGNMRIKTNTIWIKQEG